jgi:putative ABC transport system substrate-binding protein
MPFPLFADDGGLIAYGPDLIDLYRQGGAMVGTILKGARPHDLPVERPNRFLLVVNTKTAQALNLTFTLQRIGARRSLARFGAAQAA